MSPDEIAERYAALRDEVGDGVTVVVATKYLSVGELQVLVDAGVDVVGENRAQDLEQKVALYGDAFTWDFIGQLQSRKVRRIVPHVRLIHSVASESSLRELARDVQDFITHARTQKYK